jgi:cathepsin F
MLRKLTVAAGVLGAAAQNSDVERLFSEFEQKFEKKYASTEERSIAMSKFEANLKVAAELQAADQGTATFSHLTPFADMNSMEFSKLLGFRSAWAGDGPEGVPVSLDTNDTPTSYDWRTKGGVTPVKDQGQCGSCWAFATVANIEGAGFVTTGKLLSLSEQELVACDRKTGDQGCQGGLPSNAYKDMIQQKLGLELESDYPYTGKDDKTCGASASKEKSFITGWSPIPKDEDQIAAALVKYGPLAIGIDALPMQLYFGGIMDVGILCPPALDHGVTIVGYDATATKPYWVIKNSWGGSWGEKGYLRIVKGKSACGLNQEVTTATGITIKSGITDEDRAEFGQWKVQYGKSYANGEEEMRLQNYVDNRAKAAALDAENPMATFGVNEFSDLSEEEFAVYHNAQDFYAMPKDPSVPEWPAYSDEEVSQALATSIDWVSKGAVTGVKNQGQCGSCWAFSATGNIEGQWKLAGNTLTSVSEQQLVDCDHMGDQGCQGGLPENAFKYVKKSGLETEQQYAYKGRGGSCQAKGSPAVTISGQTTIQHNEAQMLTFLQQKGPISIGVDASKFQSYRGGVLTSCRAGQLDHGVLIVGYGTQGGSAYWKIKNSWGKTWGESGYIRVAYGQKCAGLNQDPTSSVVSKAAEVVV